MTLQDKTNNQEDINTLIRKFVNSSERKRKTLFNEIESASYQIYLLGDNLFNDFDPKDDDWALGWILQVLKKNQPKFFDNDSYNNFFFTTSNSAINYDNLQLNLLEQNFEEADRLTSVYLRKLAGKLAEKRGYVFYSEVNKMSDIDLISMDRLWNIYSQGKFGFSIQAKLLKAVGKKYDDLWEKIGWKKNDLWTRYPSSFCWSLDAPDGHMPLVNQLRGVRLMDSILRHPAIASRHGNCL